MYSAGFFCFILFVFITKIFIYSLFFVILLSVSHYCVDLSDLTEVD